jgi:hypothetical protein
MSDFSTELRLRVSEALRSLVEAKATGDDYELRLSLGQIESLTRLADDNQINLDGLSESLAACGFA